MSNATLAAPRWRQTWCSAFVFALTAMIGAVTVFAAPFGEGGHEAFIKQVNAGQASEYQRVMNEFDIWLETHTDDAIAAVERCLFIEFFAYSDDVTIESAEDDLKKCQQDLRTKPYASTGAAKVYLWQKDWKDGTVDEGEKFLRVYSSWTPLQQAAIHESLSWRYANASEPMKSGKHAVKAVALNPKLSTRLDAAKYLVRIGAKRRAVLMVEGMPEWQSWSLSSGIDILLGMNDMAAVNRLAKANATIDLDPVTRLKIGRAMLAAGETDAALAFVAKLIDGTALPEHYGNALERELFKLQLEHGDDLEATQAYRVFRNTGFSSDQFGRFRLALTSKHPTAPWHFEDLFGIVAFLLVLVFIVLLCALIVVPIHYRSAVKQSRGSTVVPLSDESPWTLAHLLYALAALQIAGVSSIYLFSYADFETLFGDLFVESGFTQTISDDHELGRAMWWSSIGCLFLMLPLLRGKRIRRLLIGDWTVWRSVLLGASAALTLIVVNWAFRKLSQIVATAGSGLGTDTMRAMQGINSLYGPMAMFACVAVIIPIVEELVFRGVFLRSMARHVAVWAALLVQVTIFMLWHEDPSAYPQIFALSLLASWLALKSRGLLAPITMHAVNNAIAAIGILAITN